MKIRYLATSFSFAVLVAGFTGCATERRMGSDGHYKVRHLWKPQSRVAKNTKGPKASRSSKLSDPYARGLRTGADVATYDVGRTIDKSGNLVEAHQVHRIVQDAHWNLNLPKGS